jgi:hypothetical protein
MKFRTSQILPLVSSLGKYLQMGMDEYVKLKTSGNPVDAEQLSVYLDDKMSSWNPKIKNVNLMDESTRRAGARFLAGVAVAIASA